MIFDGVLCRYRNLSTGRNHVSSSYAARLGCRRAATLNGPYNASGSGTFRMWRADVREFLQDVGVGLETCWRTLIFRQEGESVIDHVFRKGSAIGIMCRLRRIEGQHVGKRSFLIDRGNGLLARVIASVPHQVDKLL